MVSNMPNSDISAVAELAADSHRVITRTQAADHLSDHRIATAIRQGWLQEPYPVCSVSPEDLSRSSTAFALQRSRPKVTCPASRMFAELDPRNGRSSSPTRSSGHSKLLRLLDAIAYEGRVPDSWFEELVASSLDRDADRDLRLAMCGWDLLYLGWHATKNPSDVADLVADVVEARRLEV